MKFFRTRAVGFENALYGMRNAKNSWDKIDSKFGFCKNEDITKEMVVLHSSNGISEYAIIGGNDMKLAQTLIKAGSEHRKFLRQIQCEVTIEAPIYWWKEFSTYKIGTVANSTSTMHKLASTPITLDCFETDNVEVLEELNYEVSCWWGELIVWLEKLRQLHNKNMELSKASNITDQERKRLIAMAKRYWKELIRWLPESWLQTRTWPADYSVRRNMHHWRKNHKLSEWHSFCRWIVTLPYASKLLTFDN
jgi:hypothetical protein